MIGIPYAKVAIEDGRHFITCPTCGERIELKKRKDFESMSLAEYQHHHANKHHND